MNFIATAMRKLFPQSVDSITASFNRDLAALKALADNHRATADAHTSWAHDALDLADAAHAEADRALRVASRLAALID